MKKVFTIMFFVSFSCFSLSSQTEMVSIGESSKLIYTADADGFLLPDFSHAGYRGGGVDLPTVATVKEIAPIAGDNTAHIQAAIDEVGNMPLDANGVRGALLLKAGRYEILGTLYVQHEGVVLRGVGNGESPSNSTIIYAKGNTPHQRDVLVLGGGSQNKWTTQVSGTKTNISDTKVAVGASSFSVSNASSYSVGDQIAIYHPCSANWLTSVNYGGVPAPAVGEEDERWVENQVPIIYNRYITKIEGNRISVDAPLFYTLNKSLSQSFIYKFSTTGIKKEIGIENLRVDIESLGGEDENHAWQAVRFKNIENGWAKDVVTKGFGQSGFITDCTTRTTIERCEAMDPVAILTGERMYNFNTYINSQLVLFKDCYAVNGRHHYVSNGTSSASGNVFLNCVSDAVNSVNEGHRQWTQGMLYDGHKEVNLKRDFVLGLYNRVDMGTGHGWATVHSVLWNCDVTSSGIIGLQKPPTAQNYAIGCTAQAIKGQPVNASNFTLGYVEAQNRPIAEIPSLYLAQLNDRLRNASSITSTTKTDKPFVINSQTKDLISILFNDALPERKMLRMYNGDGQKVLDLGTNEQQLKIDTLSMSGVYILQIEISQNIYIEKVII